MPDVFRRSISTMVIGRVGSSSGKLLNWCGGSVGRSDGWIALALVAAVAVWTPKAQSFCGLPSSRTEKSEACRPGTKWPLLSVATTSTITSRELARKTGMDAACSDDAVPDAAGVLDVWAPAGI